MNKDYPLLDVVHCLLFVRTVF